ncbi:unnamed protein product [Bemisia tabaci]|uniref:Uncharacterized protein n=1 Tax=Bemisia tabaci TaxID=7038 RepID=A0A9P0F8M4_BEMTA|nr:unnamed protein product [Bemisia tabaci]
MTTKLRNNSRKKKNRGKTDTESETFIVSEIVTNGKYYLNKGHGFDPYVLAEFLTVQMKSLKDALKRKKKILGDFLSLSHTKASRQGQPLSEGRGGTRCAFAVKTTQVQPCDFLSLSHLCASRLVFFCLSRTPKRPAKRFSISLANLSEPPRATEGATALRGRLAVLNLSRTTKRPARRFSISLAHLSEPPGCYVSLSHTQASRQAIFYLSRKLERAAKGNRGRNRSQRVAGERDAPLP